MRNATILVVNLKGTATETIKNIVLAGIGTLVIVDGDNVTEEDLGAGFFFRDEDVGSKVSLPFFFRDAHARGYRVCLCFSLRSIYSGFSLPLPLSTLLHCSQQY